MQKYKTTKTISNIRSPTASLQSFLLGWNLCAPLLQQGRPSTQVLVSIVFFEAGNEKNIKKTNSKVDRWDASKIGASKVLPVP